MNSLRQKLGNAPRSKSPGDSEPARNSALELERVRDTFNPYTRVPTEQASSSKRDLRKLSEWIKMMRALEERKKTGQAD